ncbi:MAG: hypothetical protein H6577_21640 [Lewinellaceae bacterium]|nr:hypothetical protein [Lewinellaceae bacterium]
MQLETDYLDFLQNIEFAVAEVYKDNPDLRDPDVIKAYDRLVKFYNRKKKRMPELESSLTGISAKVFEAVQTMCEWRRKKEPGETVELDGFEGIGNDVPIVAVIRCLEKLNKSAEFWHKKDGVRGYLNFVSNFV